MLYARVAFESHAKGAKDAKGEVQVQEVSELQAGQPQIGLHLRNALPWKMARLLLRSRGRSRDLSSPCAVLEEITNYPMKRNLIRSIIACGAAFALCPGLHGQEAAPGAAGAGEHQLGRSGGNGELVLEKLTTALSLTPDQQAQVEPMIEAAAAQIRAARQEKSVPLPEKMARCKEVLESASSQINALLTPAQQTKFAELKEKIREHRQGGSESEAAPSPSDTP